MLFIVAYIIVAIFVYGVSLSVAVKVKPNSPRYQARLISVIIGISWTGFFGLLLVDIAKVIINWWSKVLNTVLEYGFKIW